MGGQEYGLTKEEGAHSAAPGHGRVLGAAEASELCGPATPSCPIEGRQDLPRELDFALTQLSVVKELHVGLV